MRLYEIKADGINSNYGGGIMIVAAKSPQDALEVMREFGSPWIVGKGYSRECFAKSKPRCLRNVKAGPNLKRGVVSEYNWIQ